MNEENNFTQNFFSRFSVIEEKTIESLVANGYHNEESLLYLDLKEDLPSIPGINFAQKGILRKILTEFQDSKKELKKSFEKNLSEELRGITDNNSNYETKVDTNPVQSSAVTPALNPFQMMFSGQQFLSVPSTSLELVPIPSTSSQTIASIPQECDDLIWFPSNSQSSCLSLTPSTSHLSVPTTSRSSYPSLTPSNSQLSVPTTSQSSSLSHSHSTDLSVTPYDFHKPLYPRLKRFCRLRNVRKEERRVSDSKAIEEVEEEVVTTCDKSTDTRHVLRVKIRPENPSTVTSSIDSYLKRLSQEISGNKEVVNEECLKTLTTERSNDNSDDCPNNINEDLEEEVFRSLQPIVSLPEEEKDFEDLTKDIKSSSDPKITRSSVTRSCSRVGDNKVNNSTQNTSDYNGTDQLFSRLLMNMSPNDTKVTDILNRADNQLKTCTPYVRLSRIPVPERKSSKIRVDCQQTEEQPKSLKYRLRSCADQSEDKGQKTTNEGTDSRQKRYSNHISGLKINKLFSGLFKCKYEDCPRSFPCQFALMGHLAYHSRHSKRQTDRSVPKSTEKNGHKSY